ncbi:MAG: tetratricopeptide repeat protein, partial [Proteobacteria bacterium]|nr:tetratricopeptide repeat protein [Pseudomonadota bacterium]
MPAALAQPTKGEDESAALVDEGRGALRKGSLDDAAKALDQAISLNPRRVDAYVLRAAVYAARKQYKDGIALMRKAQQLAPSDDEVLVALGAQLVLSGDVTTGVPILQAVVARTPSRYDAQVLLGHHAHTQGKWPESIAAYEAYFAARPAVLAREDARHRVELADAYLRYHQAPKALALFEQAIREYPTQGKADVRAQIGVAWATAAIDCRKARPMLKALEPQADQHPAIWLVDGRCALALGDSGAALAQGQRYLKKVPDGEAAGHALVGEAYAVRGNLAEARKELELAHTLEPTRRRWTVRLAHVLRRAGDAVQALEALDQLGPPTTAAIDPDWWHELGESLLGKTDAAGAVTRLAPIVVELAGDAELRTIYGAAQLQIGQFELAIKTLEEAEAIASTPRSKKLLADALAQVGTGKLRDGELDAAEAMLARSEQLDGNAFVWRNLGIARMQRGKFADAQGLLDRAAKAEPSAVTLLLAA